MVFAWVKGTVGTGKTWLCQSLTTQGIDCVDTDVIMQEVFRRLMTDSAEFRKLVRTSDWWSFIVGESTRVLEDLIREARSRNESLVIVGNSVTGEIEGIEDVYFIKQSVKALGSSYRRLLRREILKIVENSDRLLDIVENSHLDDIGPWISNVATPAHGLMTSFNFYKTIYKEDLKSAKSEGATVLTQPEIISRITNC